MTAISTLLRDAIARHGWEGRNALVDAAGVMTYAELGRLIDGYAAAFRDWGVTRGTPVGFLAPKSTAAVAAYFGAMQSGACVCFIEPALAPEVVDDQMNVVGMRYLVIDPTLRERFDVPALASKMLRSLDQLKSEDAFADLALGPATGRCCCSPRAVRASPRACYFRIAVLSATPAAWSPIPELAPRIGSCTSCRFTTPTASTIS